MHKRLILDTLLVVISVVVAIVLNYTPIPNFIFGLTSQATIIGNFIAGAMFTSVFTTGPAIVILADLTKIEGILPVAFWGALGALFNDIFIFRFASKNLYGDFKFLLKHSKYKKLKILAHMPIFRWLLPIVGALIIASPLPDEIGLFMIGCSQMKMRYFIPLSFCMNFIGIVLIGYAAMLMHL